jgi:hypothetical protein
VIVSLSLLIPFTPATLAPLSHTTYTSHTTTFHTSGVIHRKLHCALVDNRFGQDNANYQWQVKWERVASKDWEADRRGAEGIDKRKFMVSWFALIDIWTDAVDAEMYVHGVALLCVCALVLRALSAALGFPSPSHAPYV